MNGEHASKHTTLRNALRRLGQKPFVRNVAAVATGTAMAQAIAMAFAPLITRLYGPEAFGVQGVFMSLAGILASIAALTYPIAIVLPKHDADACGLAKLSIYVGLGMALVATMLLWLWGPLLLSLINAEAIADYLLLLPLFMLFSAFSAILVQWSIRNKHFGLTAKASVWHSLIINAAKTAVGTIYPSAAVLIIANTFGHLVQAMLLGFGLRKQVSVPQTTLSGAPTNLRKLADRHRDFPLMRAPQVLLNTISHSLPVIMLAGFFGPAAAGFYALANTVMALPSGLLGTSVTQVFYPTANDAYQRGENIRPMIIKATAGMALIGIVPFALVIFFGPILFEVIFGQEWETAGIYAQWLSIWLFFGYINKPAVAAIPILNLQGGLLGYELFSTGTKVLALAIGYWQFNSAIIAIALFSSLGALAYIFLIAWVTFHDNGNGNE